VEDFEPTKPFRGAPSKARFVIFSIVVMIVALGFLVWFVDTTPIHRF
jgi:hypothetical protein